MLAFLVGYKGYLYGHLLDNQEKEMDNRLQEDLSIDSIRSIYFEYMQMVGQVTFSNPEHQKVRSIFERIFEACWTLYKQTQSLEEVMLEMSCGEVDPERLEVLEVHVSRNYEEFVEQGSVLVQSIQSSRSQSNLSYVLNMYTILNFNRFFLLDS